MWRRRVAGPIAGMTTVLGWRCAAAPAAESIGEAVDADPGSTAQIGGQIRSLENEAGSFLRGQVITTGYCRGRVVLADGTSPVIKGPGGLFPAGGARGWARARASSQNRRRKRSGADTGAAMVTGMTTGLATDMVTIFAGRNEIAGPIPERHRAGCSGAGRVIWFSKSKNEGGS